MKKVRILGILVMMLVMVLVLAGCGESNNGVESSYNTTSSNSSNSSNSSSSENKGENKVDVESINFVEYAKKQVAEPAKGETVAVIHVKDYGDITVKFFNDKAPKAVENFITHSKNGYYNGVIFHRVIDDFMIQAGDPNGIGTGGESIWGKTFEDEFSYELVPYRGALCMANAGSNTNGSQFFIEQAKFNQDTYNMLKQYGYPENLLEAYKIYGGSMHLFCAHTVFGQVIDGMDVVDKITKVETDKNNYKPLEDVVIESIEIKELQ